MYIVCKTLRVNTMVRYTTRKLTLHARMSHSTVCNTTVSIKKTRRTLVKYVRKLSLASHA